MTIKEIGEKYEVPYNTVYLATYGIKPIDPMKSKDRQYPEDKVVKNLKRVIQERIEKHREKACELQEMLDHVNEIAE